jgi:hypothetical protein
MLVVMMMVSIETMRPVRTLWFDVGGGAMVSIVTMNGGDDNIGGGGDNDADKCDYDGDDDDGDGGHWSGGGEKANESNGRWWPHLVVAHNVCEVNCAVHGLWKVAVHNTLVTGRRLPVAKLELRVDGHEL